MPNILTIFIVTLNIFGLILITGSSGFIGKATALYFLKNQKSPIVLVDFFTSNNDELQKCQFVHTDDLFDFLDFKKNQITFIIHLGAITDTTEQNADLLSKYNLSYSKVIWSKCVQYSISLIYASSAATYGNGRLGFSDDHKKVSLFKPLNLYAHSKHDFDKYILAQKNKPPMWFGLKFFNVFGFDESKKGKMSSIILQAFNQILKTNQMKLFKSNDPTIKDGDQCRDFIYIDDVLDVIFFLYTNKIKSGIYNVGTGKVTTFNNIISYVFSSMQKNKLIEYIDMPSALRNQYQSHTRADVNKLRSMGYKKEFLNIEEAISQYINNYLV